MPRHRLPNLHLETSRHGKSVWYYRPGKGRRVRIRGEYGSPEFLAAYSAAATGEEPQKRKRLESATLASLIERYRASPDWARLSLTTRRQRENIFAHVIAKEGSFPYEEIERLHIVEARDRRSKTPFAAANFLKAMRGLFRWALENQFVEADPTEGVKGSVPPTDGFHPWSEEEIEKFEAHWAIGTRERLAFALLLYTGLRRGDVARLGRQHIRDSVISLRTEKTGALVELPIVGPLARIIEASPIGNLTFVATSSGKPMTKESFGNWFKKACISAGVPGSAHGLRKAGATRLANNGATVAELEAIFGWSGGNMAALYTRRADRRRLAQRAMGKLVKDENENENSLTSNSGAGNKPANSVESKA